MATTAGLRKIGKINLPNLEPNEIFGDTPRCILVNPSDLYVEEQYQRNLAENSVRLIRRLVRDWNWAHMKPPVCVKSGDKLFVADGRSGTRRSAECVNRRPASVGEADAVLVGIGADTGDGVVHAVKKPVGSASRVPGRVGLRVLMAPD